MIHRGALTALALFATASCGNTDPAEKTQVPAEASVPKAAAPAARGPDHPVYSLFDNRLAAHLVRDGALVVSGDSSGFAKYARFGPEGLPWRFGRPIAGVAAAVSEGPAVRLEVPLTGEQAAGGVRVRLRVHSERARQLVMRVNDASEHVLELPAGWATASATLEPASLRQGANAIALAAAGREPLAVAWLEIGGSSDAAPDLDVTKGYALRLPEGGGFAYHVVVPEGGRLVGELQDGPCEVAVTARPHTGEAVTGTLVGATSFVDLSALAGEVVRLELVARRCPEARLTRGALAVPGPEPTFERPAARPRYVVLWIMDSLRADRVRVFNPRARAEVPFLESLARRSTVFAQNYVQGNESKATHASIWSSLYPAVHGYYLGKKKHDAEPRMIDALLKGAGFYLSGVSGNGYVIPRRGFGDSWDAFRNHIHQPGGLRGQQILDAAVASVKGRKAPWFLYIGTIDTHVSWRAHEPWISRYDPTPYRGRFGKAATGPDVDRIAAGRLKVSPRDIERIRALYDANVSYQDDLVRQFFGHLDAWGIADQTMVIFAADHGDELFEASPQGVGHGSSLRETVVHTPLMIHYPPLFPARVVTQGTGVVDIVPTIADALGIEADPAWQGQSLVPLAHGVGASYPRLSFASQYERLHAARVGRWKYVYGRDGAELFDLEADPAEATSVALSRPLELQMLADAFWLLRAYNRVWRKSIWGNALNVTAPFASAAGG